MFKKYTEEQKREYGKEQREEIRKILDDLSTKVAAMKNSDNYVEWLNGLAKFHNYSVNNTLLILLQNPKATTVASYKTWQEMGRKVKRGEHGMVILVPVRCKTNQFIEVDDIDPDTDEEITRKVQLAKLRFKKGYVFDVAQTEGKEIPKICHVVNGYVKNGNMMLAAIKNFSDVPIKFSDMKGMSKDCYGFFSPAEREITVRNNTTPAQRIKTVIHEVAHSMLHADIDCKFTREEKETQAESVSYAVCKHYGLDTSDYSIGYLAGWSNGKDNRELKNGMELIQKTANEIINGIDAYFN